MSTETAKTIASGVGPLIAALIAAYQLWLKPRVDERRELPFDVARLRDVEAAIGRIRLLLVLFTLLVVGVTLIPVAGVVGSLRDVDFRAPVSLPQVLVACVAAVGTIHAAFLFGKVRMVNREVRSVRTSIAQKQ